MLFDMKSSHIAKMIPQGLKTNPAASWSGPKTTSLYRIHLQCDRIWHSMFFCARVPPGPQWVRGDPKCHFVTPEAYLTTFVSEIFWFVAVSVWPPGANPKCPWDPRGSGVTPNAFLSPLKHTWQLLLAKYFDLLKLLFDPRGHPECPRDPRGSGVTPNAFFVTTKTYLTTFVSKIFWFD